MIVLFTLTSAAVCGCLLAAGLCQALLTVLPHPQKKASRLDGQPL